MASWSRKRCYILCLLSCQYSISQNHQTYELFVKLSISQSANMGVLNVVQKMKDPFKKKSSNDGSSMKDVSFRRTGSISSKTGSLSLKPILAYPFIFHSPTFAKFCRKCDSIHDKASQCSGNIKTKRTRDSTEYNPGPLWARPQRLVAGCQQSLS